METKATPKFAACRTSKDNKPAVELVVTSVNAAPGLNETLKTLGYTLVSDMANRYHIICTTPAEVDAARDPLKAMFDRAGEWIGQ